MSDGDFPFRSFTLREQGYDRTEVDATIAELQSTIAEQRRALNEGGVGDSDARLHDPEGAVKRTLGIAQETADRVLHDARVEADRRRIDAEEHAAATVADAEARAAKMLADIEIQAVEVREQGVLAARSAIKVERDRAMSELAQVRRVRNDLRAEAVELKSAVDRYRHQSREAADTLAAVSAGPLLAVELPDYVDDEVILAGVDDSATSSGSDASPASPTHLRALADSDDGDGGYASVPEHTGDVRSGNSLSVIGNDSDLAEVYQIDSDSSDSAGGDSSVADPTAIFDDADLSDYEDISEPPSPAGGAFFSEIAGTDDSSQPSPKTDRFLTELRDATRGDEADDAIDDFFADD